MLEPIANDVWTVDHDLFTLGLHFPGRMTVIRLPSGELWLHSPVPLDDELAGALEALGPVRHIVAPNRFHHLHVQTARQRYPDARVYAAPGLPEKRSDLTFHEVLSEEPPAAWSEVMTQVVLRGIPAMNEVVFFHRPSGTLVTTDMFINVHDAKGLLSRFVYWAEGCWKRPRIPRLNNLLTKDRDRMRADARTICSLPVERVVMAHGELVVDDAADFLRSELRRAYGEGASTAVASA